MRRAKNIRHEVQRLSTYLRSETSRARSRDSYLAKNSSRDRRPQVFHQTHASGLPTLACEVSSPMSYLSSEMQKAESVRCDVRSPMSKAKNKGKGMKTFASDGQSLDRCLRSCMTNASDGSVR